MIQNCIGETNLVFIRQSAEAIRRRLADQVAGESEHFANLDNFMNQKMGERAEVAGSIAKFGRITDMVFRPVAGVDNTAAFGQTLGNCIKRAHTQAGRQVDLSISGETGHTFYAAVGKDAANLLRKSIVACFDINSDIGNLQEVYQSL